MAKCNLNVCLKVFMVSVNTLFLIFGMVLLAGGSYALAAEFQGIDADIIKELGIGLIVVGLFSMLLSIMGCYGAIKRRKCPLVAYMIFVFIIMIALGGVAYVLFSSKDALEKIEAGDKTGNNYVDNLNSDLGNRFDTVYCAAINVPDQYQSLLTWVDTNCYVSGSTTQHMNDPVEMDCGTDAGCVNFAGGPKFSKPNNPCAAKFTAPTATCNATTSDMQVHTAGFETMCNPSGEDAYAYCSKSLAGVFLDLLTPISSGVAAFAGLQLLLFVSSMLLCCYARGQTLEEKYDGKGTFVEFY